MKTVWINTLTNQDIYKMQEIDKTFTGIIEIKGERFVPGQWLHLPDTFIVDQVKYPFIKEVSVHLQEETKRVLTENGLNNMAQGVKESYEMYSKAAPPIAVDIKKYAPPSAASVEEVKP